MQTEHSIKKVNKTLLVMDVQAAIVKMLPDRPAFFNPLNKAIRFARDNQVPVIYVIVGFRKDIRKQVLTINHSVI